ncbi:MAG: hypothetical protein QX203_08965 [Methylococcaceae bacterium]
MFNSKKNQRGALLLIIAVIWVVSAPIIYVGSKVLPKVREIVQRPLEQELSGKEHTIEELDKSKAAGVLLGKTLIATGGVVNTISSIGAPGEVNDLIGTVVTTSSDFVTGKYYDHVMDSPPVASNPLPSDVTTVPSCSGSNLSSCTAKSSCISIGGTWRTNNTCASSAKMGCSSSRLSDCHSFLACTGAGGKWTNNKCNSIPPTTDLTAQQKIAFLNCACRCSSGWAGHIGVWYEPNPAVTTENGGSGPCIGGAGSYGGTSRHSLLNNECTKSCWPANVGEYNLSVVEQLLQKENNNFIVK